MRDRVKFFIIGNNIDKNLLNKVKDYISHDKHIKQLFVLSWIMVLRSVVGLVATIIFFVVGNLNPTFSISVISIIVLVGAFVSLISDLIDISKKCLVLSKYIKYFIPLNKKRPRHPLDIWRVYQGSVVDAQMLMAAREIAKKQIGVVYTGAPYYETIFLDSLYLKWNGGIRERLKQRWIYITYAMQYSKDCVIAHAGNELFKSKRLSYSNSVFGILYSSGYFHSALSKKIDDKSISINIVLDQRESDEEERIRLIKEWIYYCIPPEYIKTIDKDVRDADFTITDLLTNKEVLDQKKSGHNKKRGEIVIPVKRFIALENNKIDDMPIPDAVPRDVDVDIIIVGGAEQNLALQCIVNRYRQQNDQNAQIDLGFAENSFENPGNNGFLMGTESLVYGLSGNLYRRSQKEQEASCQAVLFDLKFKSMNVLSIYGFSSLATKISLCTIVYILTSSSSDDESTSSSSSDDESTSIEQAVPGSRIEKKHLVFYDINERINVLGNEPPPDKAMELSDTEVGKAWDSGDLMNNPDKLIKYIKEHFEIKI